MHWLIKPISDAWNMPKALIVCGSSRTDGTTELMCRRAAEALREWGYEAVVARPEGVLHCRDCGQCADGGCVLDDGMAPLYEEFESSDLLVLATPIHFSGPSSLIKTFVDRLQPYWFSKSSPRPSRALGLMCGGSDRPRFDHAAGTFKALCAATGMEWLGHLEVSGTDRSRTEGVSEAVERFIGERVGA